MWVYLIAMFFQVWTWVFTRNKHIRWPTFVLKTEIKVSMVNYCCMISDHCKKNILLFQIEIDFFILQYVFIFLLSHMFLISYLKAEYFLKNDGLFNLRKLSSCICTWIISKIYKFIFYNEYNDNRWIIEWRDLSMRNVDTRYFINQNRNVRL